ncbi:insulinase family protein [Geomonas sp. Red32]|uniref:M16 family metallopeptidase n=1 Tax=Geomonas sp. Red32 TaxID=2912856 RepID=UPI00202CB6AC|nr:pitrilysin family protein [Geomonas sp. Red32]MCM0082047.1 insulinase family protein [Geomonas sp. Red32]
MIKKSILENGIRVITERIPYASSVSIGIWVANGSRHERRELNGVAHFIEHLLFKGTERRSALDIAREIDSVGGVLNAFTSREYVCYYAKVLDKFLPNAVDLLTDIFLHSTFDPEEIEKERRVVLQEINMMEDTPDDLIHDIFHQQFWMGHPLGMSILGDAESVGGLTRDAIVGYKEHMYRGDDIIVSAAGNLTHEELVSLVEQHLHVLPSGSGRVETALPVYERRLEIAEKDLEQVHVCLGLKGVQQNAPERYDAFILNTILGGSMSSRLFQEVREKSGLAYSVYSYLASHADAGSLVVYAGASPENSEELLDILLRELRRFKEEPVTLCQLDAARDQLKGNLLLSLESSDNRMSRLAKNEIYFGAPLLLTDIMAGFDAVSSQSIQALANNILDNSALTLVMLGRVNPSQFVPAQINV